MTNQEWNEALHRNCLYLRDGLVEVEMFANGWDGDPGASRAEAWSFFSTASRRKDVPDD